MIDRGKKPSVVVLENVRTLKTHDGGNTYRVIRNILENKLGYKVFTQILNTANYGVPQTRNRTFIVCFANHDVEFEFPKHEELNLTMQDLLEKTLILNIFYQIELYRQSYLRGQGGQGESRN